MKNLDLCFVQTWHKISKSMVPFHMPLTFRHLTHMSMLWQPLPPLAHFALTIMTSARKKEKKGSFSIR